MDVLHVAVGVILDSENRILISRRAAGSHQGGLWEFPGGKVEAGEAVHEALARELREELGIEVSQPLHPLLKVQHDYGDKEVLLDVWVVSQFDGLPMGCEGQPVIWADSNELTSYHFPEANKPIVAAVRELLGAHAG